MGRTLAIVLKAPLFILIGLGIITSITVSDYISAIVLIIVLSLYFIGRHMDKKNEPLQAIK